MLSAPGMVARLGGSIIDAGASAFVGRRTNVRVGVSPRGLVHGEVDQLGAVVRRLSVAGLTLDRIDVSARRIRIAPGFPPWIRARDVHVGVRLRQADVDAWTRSVALPARFRFAPGGVAARAGFGGLRLAEIVIDIRVDGRRLRIVPQRAAMLGVAMRNPSTDFLRLALPLPLLPAGVQLVELCPAEGTANLSFRAPLDQPLTPRVIVELSRRLRQSSSGRDVGRESSRIRQKTENVVLLPARG